MALVLLRIGKGGVAKEDGPSDGKDEGANPEPWEDYSSGGERVMTKGRSLKREGSVLKDS